MKRKPRNTRLQTLFKEGRPRDCRPNTAGRKEQILLDHGTVSTRSQVRASITNPTPHFHIRRQFPFDNILIDAHTRSKTELVEYSRSTGYTDRLFDIPTVFPIFTMPKKVTDMMWLVVKYRKLNDITVSDPYHMPWMEVAKEKMGRAKIFPRLTLEKRILPSSSQ